ncbi:MAG: DUF2085 domain-containing protein [Acidobacteria bacterium]|nr:DUF2085 domain-containing protein [Acidobacteriota bacterium]
MKISVRSAIFVLAAALILLALAPALHEPVLSIGTLAFFSRVCHQDAARSLWIAGVPMAVCARCLGIYLGAAAGALVRIQHQVALRVLAAAAAINVVDLVTESVGLHGNWALVRVCLGFTVGMGIAATIAARPTDRRRTPLSNRDSAGNRGVLRLGRVC